VRNRIDEAVVLLVAADFVHQEAGVDDHPGNDQEEENYAKEKQHPFAPVEDDPATFSATASATRHMPRMTKNAIALLRLVMRMAIGQADFNAFRSSVYTRWARAKRKTPDHEGIGGSHAMPIFK